MRIGILIIGSLYWNSLRLREKWRQDRLCLDSKQYVKAPIRYGRRSLNWGNSYTMVFSRGLDHHKQQLGQAIAVPCQRFANNSEDLIKEAKHLWAAESNKKYSTDETTCKSWGRIVLLENRNRPIPDAIREGWKEHVAASPNYREELRHADSESRVVDNSGGFLDIGWPEAVDGSVLEMDILLTTATNPTFNGSRDYPPAQKIADAWNSCEDKTHIDYFFKNRAHGIKTFQDIDIQSRLQSL